jgi:hypothetical protein
VGSARPWACAGTWPATSFCARPCFSALSHPQAGAIHHLPSRPPADYIKAEEAAKLAADEAKAAADQAARLKVEEAAKLAADEAKAAADQAARLKAEEAAKLAADEAKAAAVEAARLKAEEAVDRAAREKAEEAPPASLKVHFSFLEFDFCSDFKFFRIRVYVC